MAERDDEFHRWLAEITMEFLKNRGSKSASTWGIADNCAMFGPLVSPQRVGEELQRVPEKIAERTTLFFEFMKRLKDFHGSKKQEDVFVAGVVDF